LRSAGRDEPPRRLLPARPWRNSENICPCLPRLPKSRNREMINRAWVRMRQQKAATRSNAPKSQMGRRPPTPTLPFAGIPTRLRGGRAHEFPYCVQGQPIPAEGANILGLSSRECGFRRMSTDIGRRPDRNEVRDRSFAIHVADVGNLRRCPWLRERRRPPAPASVFA